MFRFFSIIAGLWSVLIACSGISAQAEPPRRPNVLILHTDQLSSWAIGAYAGDLKQTPNYGRVAVETPNIDRLASEGAWLTHYFVNSAVCTPSRGCLFTGRYPHAHGAYHNNLPLNRDEITLGRLLKDQGYATGYAGKWHLDGPPRPGFMTPDRSMGFDDCRYMFNRGHWKKITLQDDGTAKVSPYNVIGDEKTFTTDWLTDRTIEFITEHRNEPFCFVVSYPDPHTPFTVREPYMSMLKPADMVVPHTAPPGLKARIRQSKAHYCGEVKCIDDNVGRILKTLEDENLLDETIIVFTTDHGEYMGEHGLWGKNQWYRTAYEVPFLIRWPKHIPAGRTVDRFVTEVDVQQTLMGLIGLPGSGREQGRDASPLLRGEKIDWNDRAWIHHASLASAGLFTPEWELVLREDGKHWLFDRVNDPEQQTNLADQPEQQERMRQMAREILQHHRLAKSPAVEWLAELPLVQ